MVIPTSDIQPDLVNLLIAVLIKAILPLETIIVDDSSKYSAKQAADSFWKNIAVAVGFAHVEARGALGKTAICATLLIEGQIE